MYSISLCTLPLAPCAFHPSSTQTQPEEQYHAKIRSERTCRLITECIADRKMTVKMEHLNTGSFVKEVVTVNNASTSTNASGRRRNVLAVNDAKREGMLRKGGGVKEGMMRSNTGVNERNEQRTRSGIAPNTKPHTPPVFNNVASAHLAAAHQGAAHQAATHLAAAHIAVNKPAPAPATEDKAKLTKRDSLPAMLARYNRTRIDLWSLNVSRRV